MLASSSHTVYVASFRDRSGDLGLVAAVIGERPGNGAAVFDSVIMSIAYEWAATIKALTLQREC